SVVSRWLVKVVSVMVMWKCLPILYFPIALPTEMPILPAPARVPRATRSATPASSLSVAASSSERLRARWAASAGLRQAINRSPGTVTLIGMSSRAVSFGSAAMDQLWGVDISGGSVERGNLIPDREAIGHHLSVVGRRQQVPTDPEMWRNAAERRQEPLGMPG